jgi:hypothetical protein
MLLPLTPTTTEGLSTSERAKMGTIEAEGKAREPDVSFLRLYILQGLAFSPLLIPLTRLRHKASPILN